VVSDIAHEGDQLAPVENGHGHVHIGQVGSTRHVRIIGDENVSLRDIAAEFGQQVTHQTGHGGDVDRKRRVRLHDQAAMAVADRR
jgi:hypothetical protein